MSEGLPDGLLDPLAMGPGYDSHLRGVALLGLDVLESWSESGAKLSEVSPLAMIFAFKAMVREYNRNGGDIANISPVKGDAA